MIRLIRSHPWRPLALLAAALCLASAAPALAAKAAAPALEGTVTRVTDGDSLWLEPANGGAPVELRLLGIDAPEICQAWGPEAREALRELVLHKGVSVRGSGRDTYGRTLGTVFLDGLNVNKKMVQEGHAWSARYKYDHGPYVADERMARALSRGLNRDGGAVMPRDFRRAHGPCTHEDMAQGPPKAPAGAAVVPVAAGYRCDGRQYCSQMHSCVEATWFLQHCPGMKMDGDGDGVPCEKQWCRP